MCVELEGGHNMPLDCHSAYITRPGGVGEERRWVGRSQTLECDLYYVCD